MKYSVAGISEVIMIPEIKINQQRIWDSLMTLGQIGGTEEGGCCRLALTELDRQARDTFINWCKDAGCEISIDQIGNIFARRPGTNPDAAAITTGSHLDTQPTGGKFDGIYGCLAGLEVIRTLNDHNIQTFRPVEVSVWTNEEGSRFAPAMIASGVFCGEFDIDYGLSRADSEGVTIGEALKQIGYDGAEPVGQRDIHRFFELHIEQGPVLEQEKLDIGIVTGVLGMRWYDLVIKGTSAHAGPTPMAYRQDALYASACMIKELFELAHSNEEGNTRSTFGCLDVIQPSRNVIPGEVRLTVDLRHSDLDGLQSLEQKAREIIAAIAEQSGTTAELNCIWDSPPTAFAPECIEAVGNAVKDTGLSYCELVSGAGHDAVYLSRKVPTSMIFVPSVGGISHNEAEWSTIEQIGAGTQVLFNVMQTQANI
ncbi:Zn-dependent hydrolase [Amphritea balenae]|nr:Zn-dependent hydrolase [Amphritea balenae]GGK56696.1 Zn-dependent hydrolase [Amphritea balenae]